MIRNTSTFAEPRPCVPQAHLSDCHTRCERNDSDPYPAGRCLASYNNKTTPGKVPMSKLLLLFLSLALTSAWSQRITDRRAADIRGGGGGDGKCTIEVEVDDVAEVEIIGRNATIRTLNGGPATFRRFVCNQEMPLRPNDFRFKGIDGRGRQDLVRGADNGGRAIIRIEDSKGGSEGYTFDIFWRGGGGGSGGFNGGGGRYDNGGNNGGNRGGWNNGWGEGGGWNNNGDFNFNGGRRGSGSYRDRNGNNRRLDQARVMVHGNGGLTVEFQTESGRILFTGSIERRQGRRIYSRVRTSGMTGEMELEMGSQNTVNRITIRDIDLNWAN